MSTSVTLMATRGHCRKCQLISNEGFLAAETGQSPSLERQTFSRWNMPHSPDSPQIGQNAWSGLRQLANLENGVIFAAENDCLSTAGVTAAVPPLSAISCIASSVNVVVCTYCVSGPSKCASERCSIAR